MVAASFAIVVVVLVGASLLARESPTGPGVIRAADPATEDGTRPDTDSPPPTSPRVQPSRDQWEALLPRLQEEVALDPDDAAARRRLALALYNLDRLDEAQAIYEDLLAEGEDALVRNRLGNVLREKNDLAGAEASYRQALEDDPALPAPYLNLAELLWRLRRTEEALSLLDRGLPDVAPEARPALERAAAAIRAGADPEPAAGD